MQAMSFSFENMPVRTLGNPETPLFVAIDVVKALGFKDTINPIKRHVDPEDLIKVEIETAGGRQTVNAVNESGLYALIFGSKLESAKRFKRWVTSEVLPAIRRTGRYEAPKPEYITVEHRWAIQKAVGRKARGQSVHYQTVYRALKDHFKVEKYTHILEADFDAAIDFIESLLPMELPPPNEPAPKQISAAPQKEPRKFLVDEKYLERQRTFIYNWRYLFRDELETYLRFLRMVDSPRAPHLWEAIHDLSLSTIEVELAKYGYDVKELDCYKSWASHQPKRLTA
ncbi:BRO family protein [Sutterella wadsworthensis]|uniref:BRO family protein n=1 Tax=Sutterella wadsworthensis TaxID=40545 RepID=UPI003FEE11D0